MPQWLLAAKCEIVASNLRKIETGQTQPGVMLAVRLVATLGAHVGEFFQQLAGEEGLLHLAENPVNQAPQCGSAELNSKIAQMRGSVRRDGCPFGPLFKDVRVFCGVSQKIIAEKAGYHLRNMLEVEKGEREPGVMTALAMVAATGVDVGVFFSELHELEQAFKPAP